MSIKPEPYPVEHPLSGMEKHEEREYVGGRLVRLTFYITDDGNGNFSDKVREIVYTYAGSKLMNETTTLYSEGDVPLGTSITHEYKETKTGNVVCIKKVRI